MERRAAIYLRISSDVAGEGLGVARQEQDCRKLAEVKGWTVSGIYCDNDVSAYRKKNRPEYQRMLQDIESGQVDAVIAWHADRLHRRTAELVGFIDAVNAHDVAVETCASGTYDLSTPAGRMTARILGAVAEHESELKSQRIRRKLEQNAALGKHHGGSRPYGWLDDRITLDEHEADGVRLAAKLILRGESVRSTTKALNDCGFTTSRGLPWRDVTTREMVLRPRNAALRLHQGQVVGGGSWEPILTTEEHAKITAILNNPSRVTNPGKNGRVHLCSVIARCGLCGSTMIGSTGKGYKGKRGKPIYRCSSRGHLSRDQATVDDVVTGLVIGRLAMKDAKKLLAKPKKASEAQKAEREVKELTDLLQEAAAGYAAKKMNLAQFTAINSTLEPKLEMARAATVSSNKADVLGDLVTARDPETVWAELSPTRRKAVVDVLMDITIFPTSSGPRHDLSTIQVEWKL